MPSISIFCWRGIYSSSIGVLFSAGLSLLLVGNALAQSSSPLAGEGIYSLLDRNGIQPTSANVSEFKSLNSNRMLANGGLRRGTSYVLPVSGTIRYDLFGDDYASIKKESSALGNVAFFLVSGHGGRDPGAVGTRDGKPLHEDEYAYDVTLRVAHGLMSHGAEIHMMVTDDDGIRDTKYLTPDQDERNADGSPVSRNKRVQERVEQINVLAKKSTAQIKRVIEIHVDARERSSTQVDVHFYYNSPQGLRLSSILRDTMR